MVIWLRNNNSCKLFPITVLDRLSVYPFCFLNEAAYSFDFGIVSGILDAFYLIAKRININ